MIGAKLRYFNCGGTGRNFLEKYTTGYQEVQVDVENTMIEGKKNVSAILVDVCP